MEFGIIWRDRLGLGVSGERLFKTPQFHQDIAAINQSGDKIRIDCQGAIVGVQRFFWSLQLPKEDSKVVERSRLLRVEGESLVAMRCRLLDSSKQKQGLAQSDVCLNVGGIEGKRFPIMIDRFFPALKRRQGISQVHTRVDIIRPNLYRPFACGERFLVALQSHKRAREIVMCLGISRVERNRLLIFDNGLIGPLKRLEGVPQIIARFGVRRVYRQCFPVMIGGLPMALQQLKRVAEIVVHLRIFRPQFQRLLVAWNGFLQPPQAGQRYGKMMMSVSRSLVDLYGSAEQHLGVAEPTLVQANETKAERGIEVARVARQH